MMGVYTERRSSVAASESLVVEEILDPHADQVINDDEVRHAW